MEFHLWSGICSIGYVNNLITFGKQWGLSNIKKISDVKHTHMSHGKIQRNLVSKLKT